MRWLEPWVPIESNNDRMALEVELGSELVIGHPLHGVTVSALARRRDGDDVLFALADGRVAEVYLTWRDRSESDSHWPLVEFYSSLATWSARRMAPQHEAWRAGTEREPH
jgi:hypothetical protein